MLIRRHADTLGFVRSLELHHPIRWHAALLLVAAALSGLLLSLLLLWMGLERPWLRFPIAVVAAYGCFLLYVNWWLAYIGLKRAGDELQDPGVYPEAGEPGAECAPQLAGGGGSFDGGGASASFDAGAVKVDAAARAGQLAARAGVESKLQGAAHVDDVLGAAAGAAEFFPVAILVAAVIAVVAAIGWSVALTPAVLVETAVEVAVASGFIRGASRTKGGEWFVALFDRTVWKAVALALAAFALGIVVRWIDPQADTLGQAIAHLMAR